MKVYLNFILIPTGLMIGTAFLQFAKIQSNHSKPVIFKEGQVVIMNVIIDDKGPQSENVKKA